MRLNYEVWGLTPRFTKRSCLRLMGGAGPEPSEADGELILVVSWSEDVGCMFVVVIKEISGCKEGSFPRFRISWRR